MEPEEIKPWQYKCCICGGIFFSNWTEEEAKAELKENFGVDKQPEDGIACDDCYRKFMQKNFN